MDRNDIKLFVKPAKWLLKKDYYVHRKHVILIQYEDPIPRMPRDTLKRRNVTQFHILYNRVHELFERFPIWFRRDIEKHPELCVYLLGEVLPLLAYTFSNGPWRGLWCRHGYDPREHPEARFMQVLDLRMTRTEFIEMVEK